MHSVCNEAVGGEIGHACWETDSKKVYMSVFKQSGTPYLLYVTLTGCWKTSPKVRSNDNIGLRGENVSFNNGGAQVIWYKIGEGGKSTVVNYSNPKSSSNGRGYSVTLPLSGDNIPTLPIVVSMHQYLTIPNISGYGYAIYGAYSHAKSPVTYYESLGYNFSASGKGGVFEYTSTTIANKYDNMQGVSWSSIS